MSKNIDLLETLLTEMRIKYHFEENKKIVKMSMEDLCVLLLEYTKLLRGDSDVKCDK